MTHHTPGHTNVGQVKYAAWGYSLLYNRTLVNILHVVSICTWLDQHA
jgi:hypothetical protein